MPQKKWIAAFALATAATLGVSSGHAAAPDDLTGIKSLSGAYLAARVAEADNDLTSAVKFYRQALAFDPDNVDMQQNLMLALISRGSFDQALPYATKLKDVASIERFSRVALAVEAFRKKDYDAAHKWLKLDSQSDLDRLITGLMTAWADEGKGDSKAALRTLRKLDGPDWYKLFVSYHTALIADAAGKKDVADTAYGRTLDNVSAGSAAPDTYLRAALAYARFLDRDGDKTKALAVLDRADRFVPDRPTVVALRQKIESGAKIGPLVATPADGASEVLLDLGAALNRGGGEDFVRLYLEYALVLKPDSDAVLLQLGVVAEQQHKAQEAIDFYSRIPDASPVRHIAELQLCLNLADLGRYDEAVTRLKKLIKEQPDDMRSYLALGGVYDSKKDYRDAAGLFDEAVARVKDPQKADWTLFYQRGIAYERIKEWPKAEPNFKEALKLYPDQPQVLNYLGYSWVDMGIHLDQGLKMIRKAVEQRPSDGYIVDSLGWAYYKLGHYKEAATELERAVSLKPEDPVLNDHLGDAYWRIGRKLEATFQWRHASDLDPDSDLLASVQKKLSHGLPPVTAKKAAEMPAPPNALKPGASDKSGTDGKG